MPTVVHKHNLGIFFPRSSSALRCQAATGMDLVMHALALDWTQCPLLQLLQWLDFRA